MPRLPRTSFIRTAVSLQDQCALGIAWQKAQAAIPAHHVFDVDRNAEAEERVLLECSHHLGSRQSR